MAKHIIQCLCELGHSGVYVQQVEHRHSVEGFVHFFIQEVHEGEAENVFPQVLDPRTGRHNVAHCAIYHQVKFMNVRFYSFRIRLPLLKEVMSHAGFTTSLRP
ncbi:hypothetical protein E2C01_022313 [Portunus trituberculatus]|uniref:Uncharacterized protein n=1 Tax=Portunus trituberculatus TaxID=210409 RepID=A0A5B7E6Y5_PORTR|nr:hypothetical protein [Portunus trituberculatus]